MAHANSSSYGAHSLIPEESTRKRHPLPFPDGWFAVGFSDDLKPGTLHTVPFMDEEVVLYRTRSGIARIIEPYCPHLGAHLGYGSKVDGEHLICPFHGLRYGIDGYCSKQGAGAPLQHIRLNTRETRELNGLLYVWHDSKGRPPAWELPLFDLVDYSPPRESLINIRGGHIQDCVEGAVDLAHMSWLHGLADPVLSPPHFDQHRMEIDLTAVWHGLPFIMHLDIYGLGYVHLISKLPSLGVSITTLLTSTPVRSQEWIIRHAQRLQIPLFVRFPSLLQRVLYAPLTWYIDYWLKSQLKRDAKIWHHRRYKKQPCLTSEDGPIMRYRQWTTQFYSAMETGCTMSDGQHVQQDSTP